MFYLNFYAVSVLFNTVLDCHVTLTLILLTWRKWWTPNNASKWQMGFNSAFKGLIVTDTILQGNVMIQSRRFLTVYKSSQDQLHLLNCKTRFFLWLVWFGLFVHPLSHTHNSGHVNCSLQFIYYNITYNVWTSAQYNIVNKNTKFKGKLEVEPITTSRYMHIYINISKS
jgi:hypothetical protein